MGHIHELLYGVHSQSQKARLVVGAVVPLCLAGCTKMPTGQSVAVMLTANKPFDVFMQEDQLCRGWSAHSNGLAGHDAAAENMLRSTVAGATIGALAGAITGGDRQVSASAAIGTVIGATAGAQQGSATAWQAQRRYDIAYQQCMYFKGNLLPRHGYGSYPYAPLPSAALPPPPPPAAFGR